jgi:RHS repeat-associated protein
VTGSRTESYTYDANGNRTGTGYSTTVMNETATSPGVITYTYDSAGNTISANSGGTFTTYTYDYRNRLTGVKQGGTVIATYVYDALDRSIETQDSGGSTTWTVYNGTSADALPYGDFNSSGTLLARYVSGPGMVNGAVVDELLARTGSGGTSAWYLTDKLNSVRYVVNSSGSAIDHVVYDSFGNITTETSAGNGDRFKFAGMDYDATTGQDYDRARWYGPEQGKFLARDSIGFRAGDRNLYRYAGNDLVNAIDPTGNSSEETETNQNHPDFDPLDPSLWYEYLKKVGPEKVQSEIQQRFAKTEKEITALEAQLSILQLQKGQQAKLRAGQLKLNLIDRYLYMLVLLHALNASRYGDYNDFEHPPINTIA